MHLFIKQKYSNIYIRVYIYIYIELVCCTPETNMTLYINYTSKKERKPKEEKVLISPKGQLLKWPMISKTKEPYWVEMTCLFIKSDGQQFVRDSHL